jgi:hypothetical protein
MVADGPVQFLIKPAVKYGKGKRQRIEFAVDQVD